MKRILSTLLALAVLAALLVITTTFAHALSPCSLATLNGNYAVNVPGFISPGQSVRGAEVPLAAVGVYTFDGFGNWSNNYTLAINGEISAGRISSGTYTVNSNCTGSITSTAGDFIPNFNIVIIGGGTEIFGIETTPGFTGTLVAKRQ